MSSTTLSGTKGGSGVAQRIISEIPPHDVFIEPFWGRGTIARKIKPAAITIGCDLDDDAIANGREVALMFRTCGIQWLRDYFANRPDPAAESGVARATFGGYPFARHFVYIDPPYWGCPGYYKHEPTEGQHVELMRLFLALPCPAALSGYITPLHRVELAGCRRISYITVKRSGAKVREYLWLNYPQPAALHDARFVGGGRRGRERIWRRVNSWRRGLLRMPPLERQAVFEALADAYAGDDAE